MSKSITYRPFEMSDLDAMEVMGRKLWSGFKEGELRELLVNTAQDTDRKQIWIALDTGDKYVGFTVFSVRTDYVEGAVKSPTGYLEGIFVEEAYRKKGIAEALFHLGEQWCKDKGCTQIGSDTWLSAQASRNFHQKLGFWEEDVLVHFLKDI